MTTDEPRQDQAGGVLLPLVVAIVLVVVAVATIWRSIGLDYWTALGPGPGFLPFWIGVLLLGLSIGWSVRTFRARRRSTDTDTDTPLDVRRLVVVVVSLVALATLLEVLGYQLSMALFLFFHLKVLGRRGWLLSVAIALAGSFGVFTVFTRLLTVDLPTSSIDVLRGVGF